MPAEETSSSGTSQSCAGSSRRCRTIAMLMPSTNLFMPTGKSQHSARTAARQEGGKIFMWSFFQAFPDARWTIDNNARGY